MRSELLRVDVADGDLTDEELRAAANAAYVELSDRGVDVDGVVPLLNDPTEPEMVEVAGEEVPKPLADFYGDDVGGLISVRPEADGIIVYESCSRIGGLPAVEIPHADPYLVDESHLPGGSSPPMTFGELVRKHGVAAETVNDYTYVYVPEAADV